jgi:hypothetical protein
VPASPAICLATTASGRGARALRCTAGSSSRLEANCGVSHPMQPSRSTAMPCWCRRPSPLRALIDGSARPVRSAARPDHRPCRRDRAITNRCSDSSWVLEMQPKTSSPCTLTQPVQESAARGRRGTARCTLSG